MVSLGRIRMRVDVSLYIIALICFVLAGYLQSSYTDQFTYVITLTILGVVFLGIGYSMRPKPVTIMETKQLQVSETKEAEAGPEAAPKVESEAKVMVTAAEEETVLELTSVKGIGPKRAEQLKSIGIQSAEELANKSSEELAEKLKVSAKIAEKWIKAAKKLVKKD